MLNECKEFMVTEGFRQMFGVMCQMDSIPDISLQQMKLIKSEFIEKILTEGST